LLDQYAYKITGSAISMLICPSDMVGRLLESNQYVSCEVRYDWPFQGRLRFRFSEV